MEIKKEINRSALRIEITKSQINEAQSSFREQMLIHNKLEGLLSYETMYENGTKVLEYSIGGMNSVESVCLQHKLGRKELVSLMDGILLIAGRLSEYMLSADDLIITADSVFLDSTGSVRLAYCPEYSRDLIIQLQYLSEFLMNSVDYKDESAVLLIYSFYMKTKDSTCNIDDLSVLLMSESSSNISERKTDEAASDYVKPSPANDRNEKQEWQWEGKPGEYMRNDYSEPTVKDIVTQSPLRLKLVSFAIPFICVAVFLLVLKSNLFLNPASGRNYVLAVFATGVVAFVSCVAAERRLWSHFSLELKDKLASAMMRDDEATVLLIGTDSKPLFSLVSDQYPSINVPSFPFYIGSKDDRYIDYVLQVTGVSKYHLKIDKDGDTVVISDLNSRNGTYLNGTRLQPHIPAKVRRGDEIKLAGCVYYCN